MASSSSDMKQAVDEIDLESKRSALVTQIQGLQAQMQDLRANTQALRAESQALRTLRAEARAAADAYTLSLRSESV